MPYTLYDLYSFFETMYSNLPQVQITYQRGDDQISLIEALVGKSNYESTNEYGSVVVVESTDYICKSEALSGLFPPQRGDRVVVGSSIYEVIEPTHNFLDQYKKLIRIHSKRLTGTDDAGGIEVIESTTSIRYAGETTDSTVTEIFCGDTYSERFDIEVGRTYLFEFLVIGMDIDNINAKSWKITGTIKRTEDGTVSLIGSTVKDIVSAGTDTETWDANISADNTNKSLKVEVTPDQTVDLNMKWNAQGRISELRA